MHDKVAQAFCTEEICQDRILCYICIRSTHPHHEDKFHNIIELFKFKQPVTEPNPIDYEKYLQEFKDNTLSITKSYERVKKEIVWLDYLAKIVQANSSSLKPKMLTAQAIKSGLENLISKSPDKTCLTDGPELSQLINSFLQVSSGNPVQNEKVLSRQKTIQKLIEELIAQLLQLTDEVSIFPDSKTVKEEVWRNRKNAKKGQAEGTQLKPTNMAPGVSQSNGVTSEKPKNIQIMSSTPSTSQKPGGVAERLELIQKAFHSKDLPISGSSAVQTSKTQGAGGASSTNALNLTPFLYSSSQTSTVTSNEKVQQIVAQSKTYEKTSVIVIPENDSSPADETLTLPTNAQEKQKPDYPVITAIQAQDYESMRQEIKAFFERNSKATTAVIEAWLQWLDKLNLDPQLKFNLQRQGVIIEAFNKTKKQYDIISVNKEAERFLSDLNSKILKPPLREFEEKMHIRKQMFIEEERNWLEESKIEGLLSLMKESKVEFTQHEEELRTRLKSFNSYWKEIEAKIDLKRVQRIEFAELEQMVRTLWAYRVKFPLMEKLLEKYFDCKHFQVSVKYFLIRYKQLETERFKLFAQATDKTQLKTIIEQLKEISLSIVSPWRKKALELGEKIDFGGEFKWFLKLVEDTEQSKKVLNDALRLDNPDMYNPNLIQTQVITCMHAFYFEEMIHLRVLYLKLEPVKGAEFRAESAQSTNTTPVHQATALPSATQVIAEGNLVTHSHLNQTPLRDRMVEEHPQQPTQTQQLPQTQRLTQTQSVLTQKSPSASPRDLLSNPVNLWLRDTATYIASLLERSGNGKKALEIYQKILKFDNGIDVSSPLCGLCSTSTQDLLKYCTTKEKDALENMLLKAAYLQPPLPNDVQRLLAALNTLSWQLHTSEILKKPTQTLEQLEESLASLLRRGLDISSNSLAQSMQDRVTKFKALKSRVQSIQSLNLRTVIEEASFESVVSTLESLEKTYKQLSIEDSELLKAIETGLRLFRQGEKVSKHPSSPKKFKLQELEQFFTQINSCLRPEDPPNAFITTLNEVVSQARKDQAEMEQKRMLTVAHLSEILTDFLQNTVTRQNFVGKIAEVKVKMIAFKTRLSNLSIELVPGYFENLDYQLETLSDMPFKHGLKVKKTELLKYITLLESQATSLQKCLLYWTIIASAMLKVKKFSIKLYQKFVLLSDKLLKRNAIRADTPLFQALLTEFCRVKSLHSELIHVKGTINAKKKNAKAGSKQNFVPLNIEYLRGLCVRIKKGRLASKKILKRIKSLFKKNRRYEAVFDTFIEKQMKGERISQEEFNKFVKNVDKSVAISRKLDSRIEETFQKRKSLEKELLELKSDEIEPNDLLQRMKNFSDVSYAEYPIVSKKCESFLKEFAAYQLLYDGYQKLEEVKENVTTKQLRDFERKLEEYESNISKNRSYNFALKKMKGKLRRLKVSNIEKIINHGIPNEIQITLEDVQKLIQELSPASSDQEGGSTEYEGPYAQQLSFLIGLSEKISTAISEINQANSIDQLESALQKAVDQFHGNVDFISVYNSKKDELKQLLVNSDSPLLKPIPLNLSFHAEPFNIPIEPSQNSILGGMEIESQREGESSQLLQPIRIEEFKSESFVREKHSEDKDSNVLDFNIFNPSNLVPVMSGDVVVIIEPSDSSKKNLTRNNGADSDNPDIENFEPPLVKKVKDNEGNQILAESAEPEDDRVGLLKEKLSKLIYKEGRSSPRKSLGKHLYEMACVIQDEIEGDSSHKEEQYWLELFSQLVSEVDSLKTLWKLLDEEFDQLFFRKILLMNSEQRKEFERKAYEEVERTRMFNPSARQIISRLQQPVKFARKSLFEP